MVFWVQDHYLNLEAEIIMTNISENENVLEAQKKDEFWWIHPNLRGKAALNPGDLPGIPYDSYSWVHYSNNSETEDYAKQRALPPGEGNYAELEKVLSKKINFTI